MTSEQHGAAHRAWVALATAAHRAALNGERDWARFYARYCRELLAAFGEKRTSRKRS